jgi:type II secretory pathway pseudopilin PulG
MQSTQEARMEREAALQMASVEEMMSAARRARDRQLLELESEEALARTQLERVFLPPTFGA